MHLVTKILIVFAALFAVLLAALAMAFSYNAQTIRESVNAERAEKAAAMSNLNVSQTAWQTELATAKTNAEQAIAASTAMRNELASLMNERSKLQADLKAAQLEAASAGNESKGKDARLQTVTEMAKALNDENAKLRADHVRMAKEQTETLVRLSELESQNQVATQNVRSLQEQMADMVAAQNKSAAKPGDTRSGVEVTTGPLVTARVTKTAKAPSGDELAFITAGSAAGLKVGQSLNVVRGNKFIGKVVLQHVDLNEASGRIDTLGTANAVMADDTVLSRVN